MFRVKLSMQHIFNPLHVYCRLCPILGRKKARAFTRRYETVYLKIL